MFGTITKISLIIIGVVISFLTASGSISPYTLIIFSYILLGLIILGIVVNAGIGLSRDLNTGKTFGISLGALLLFFILGYYVFANGDEYVFKGKIVESSQFIEGIIYMTIILFVVTVGAIVFSETKKFFK